MRDEPQFEPQLLDLHLGRLSDAERDVVLQRVASDPQAARDHEALSGIFAALQSIQSVPAPSADLGARIAAKISAAPRLRVVPRTSASREGEGNLSLVRRVFSIRDVIASAAMVVLIVGVGVPSLMQVRERSQRMACSSQLARLGQGFAMYGSTFGDSLPFTGWSSQATWAPSNDPSLITQPNRRHLYPLVRIGAVNPQSFICPSTSDVAMSHTQVTQFDDFPDSRNESFAYQNMAGVRPNMRGNADLPVVADDNPLFDNGRCLLTDISTRLGLQKAGDQNSRAHGGHGQNILTIGGRVKWTDTPKTGVNEDNIWTLQGEDKYTGREGPQSATDSHLLK